MRKIASGFLAILVACTVLAGLLPAINATPPSLPAIWITPDQSFTTSTPVGTSFVETVYAGVASGQDVFTYQVNVTYDPTMLNATSVKYTAPSGSLWWSSHSTTRVNPVINRTSGLIVLGETLFAPDFEPGPSSGSICNITFAIIATPTTGHNFTCKIDAHQPKGSYLLAPDLSLITPLNFQAATYLYVGSPAPVLKPPVALFDYSPKPVIVGQTVTFDASASYDPDGTVVNWAWDFGDSSGGSGKIVTHTYSSVGNYVVNLTLTDNDSLTNSTTKSFLVSLFQPTSHQVVVSSVTPSTDHVYQGDSLPIGVVVLNNGTLPETFVVNATYDGTLIGEQTVTSLAAGNTQTLTFTWNTISVAAGNHTIAATATPVLGQTDLSSISKTAEVEVLTPTHQIVVSSVTPSSANVTQGVVVSFNVVVLNNGTMTETSVVVNATANGTLIGQQPVPSLAAGFNETLTFTWNTAVASVGNYTVTATVTPVANQTDLSSISMSVTVSVSMGAAIQYYLSVTSQYGMPTPPSGWFNSGTSITENVTSPVSGGSGIRYVCTGWTGTGSVPATGAASSVTFAISANSTITWNWKTQCYLNVTSLYGSPSPSSGWFDSGTSVSESVTSPVSGGSSGTQYLCTGWFGSGSIPVSGSGSSVTFTISAASSIVWNWKTQYYLTVTSVYDSATPVSGWFDSGSSVTESVTSPASGPSGTRYSCTGWSGSGSVPASGSGSSVTFAITAPSAITWNWKTQYYLTVTSLYDSPSPLSGWFDSGSSITEFVTSPLSGGSGTQFVSTGWSGTGSVPASGSTLSVTFTINMPSSIIWIWKTQYYLTVTSAQGSPTPVTGWFDLGSNVTESVISPVSGAYGTRYVCTGWTGEGSIPSSGSEATTSFTMNEASIITWTWKAQYQVTLGESGVGSNVTGAVVSVDSVNYALSGLPVSFWWDSGSSHSFSFVSPLTVGSIQYVWSSTSGLSPLQGGTLTITGSGSIVGNYAVQTPPVVQFRLSLWLFPASIMGLALVSASVSLVFLGILRKTKGGKHSH